MLYINLIQGAHTINSSWMRCEIELAEILGVASACEGDNQIVFGY